MSDRTVYIISLVCIFGIIAVGQLMDIRSYVLIFLLVIYAILLSVEYKMVGREVFDFTGKLRTFILVVSLFSGGFGLAILYSLLMGYGVTLEGHFGVGHFIALCIGMLGTYWLMKRFGLIDVTVEATLKQFKRDHIRVGNRYLFPRESAGYFIEFALIHGLDIIAIYGYEIESERQLKEEALGHPKVVTESIPDDAFDLLNLVDSADEIINYFEFALDYHGYTYNYRY